jgi:exosome complex component RRP42
MEISNLTRRRIKEYLETGKRFDNRGLLEHREIEIETGISKNAEGSARVRIGKTEVVAGVKMDVGTPYTDHEGEGTMMTTMELLPLSSEAFDYGPPRIDSIEIARITDRGIRESKMIDFEKLCIKKGEKVWSIFIDMYSINDDGNLLDTCCFAAVAALMSAKMPKYDEKLERVAYGELTNKGLPLTKNIPLTFTFHKIGKSIILDPSREEEESSEARISLELSCEKKDVMINAVQKGNEKPFTEKELLLIIDLAEEKYKKTSPEIFEKIEKSIKAKEK